MGPGALWRLPSAQRPLFSDQCNSRGHKSTVSPQSLDSLCDWQALKQGHFVRTQLVDSERGSTSVFGI